MTYVLPSGIVCILEIDALFPAQVILYMNILEKLLPNSWWRRIAGASAALFGFRSVAGKHSISNLENVCKWARLGPSAATASAMGIAWALIMVWVSPVNWESPIDSPVVP